MEENKTAWVEISSDALAYNLGVVRKRLKKETKLCAVIKGNAYGHGLTGVKKILSDRKLADMIAVGKPSEMLRIIQKTEDDGMDVLLLGMSEAKEVEALLHEIGNKADRVIFSVYNMRHFYELNELGCKLGRKIRVHIRVDIWDSGMGLGYEQFLTMENELFQAEGILICGLYGHLYSAYYEKKEETKKELETFDTLVNSISREHREQIIVHVMNSSLTFSFPEYSYDMVRVGTAMYGLACGDGGCLKPVMRICARIFDVREIDGSTPLSYEKMGGGGRMRKIARAMVGYCDCPLLLAQDDVRVVIGGKVYPLADGICMDNLCVDVTGSEDVAVGDVAILLGVPGVMDMDILQRNNMEYVHADWLSMTADRLDKVYL